MDSRPKQNAKMDKTDERSLEERLDHLTTTVESQQKLLDRFMALYESEKLQSLPQREDEEKHKKLAIVAKDTEIDKLRQEISKLKLAMERQTSIYVRDKIRWEQEQDQLRKELERYKALSQDNQSTQTTATPSNDAPKSQIVCKDHSKQYKCTVCNEFSSNFQTSLDLHGSVGCKAGPPYVCTECNLQFLNKEHYDEHAFLHARKVTMSDQVAGISAAFARNKRRQAIRDEYQREFDPESAEPKVTNVDDSESDDYSFKLLNNGWGGQYVEGVFRKYSLASVAAPSARPKRKISPDVRNAFFAPLRNLAQKSPASALAADQKQTLEPQIEKNQVLSPSQQAEVDRAVESIMSLAKRHKSVPDSTAEEKPQVKLEETEKKPESFTSPSEDGKSSSTVLPESLDLSWRPKLRQRFLGLLLRHPCTDSSACSILAFRGFVDHANECRDGPDCGWYICKRVQAKTEHLKTCRDRHDCTFCQSYICFNNDKMQNMMKVLVKGCPLNSGSEMSESMKGAVMTMVARLAVNYGLVGDEDKVDDEDETTELEEEEEAIDVDTVSSPDEEETSGEEETSEEWEVIEAERRGEVD